MAEDISREKMREAITIAKAMISVGRGLKTDVEEATRLLTEAIAASYRLDYCRAYGLAQAAQAAVIEGARDEARQAGFESGLEQGQMQITDHAHD